MFLNFEKKYFSILKSDKGAKTGSDENEPFDGIDIQNDSKVKFTFVRKWISKMYNLSEKQWITIKSVNQDLMKIGLMN